MNAGTFNRHAAAGRDRAEAHLEALTRGYLQALQAAGKRAADRFASLATVHLTADASNPGWTPPEEKQLIDQQELAADAKKRTRAAHRAALKSVAAPALADIGIEFSLTNPLVAGLIDTLGVRTQDLGDALSGQIAEAVLASYQQGLSVADTAKAIKDAAWGIAPSRAAMLARTDLNGIANGGSILAARLVNGSSEAGEPLVGYKQWIATEDERTRESHAQADGQVVPIDQPFQVGGEEADYPASPDLSDEEAANCRCAVGFLETADAAGATVEQEMPLAASSSRPSDGVASTGHMDTSLDAPLTADVTITVGDDTAPAAADTATPTRWRAILCIEGQETQDNASLTRMLAEGETTWRDLPLPLGVMYETPHSDEVTAELCGQIDAIYRDDTDFRVIWGEGSFNTDENGARAAARVGDLSLRGISIDPYVPEIEMFDEPAPSENGVERTRLVMHNAVICAATICPVQALDGAQITLVASVDRADHVAYGSATCFLLRAVPLTAAASPADADVSARLDAVADRLDDLARMLEDRDDRDRSMKALIAAAVEEASVPKQQLAEIGKRLERIDDELTRKPRTVQFERDADGKLAGIREG